MTNEFTGAAIEIRYARDLRDTAGNPAHAATFIRRRLIVLDEELRGDAAEHARILAHELLHFVWARLGNGTRLRWEHVLRREIARGMAGEAGWSAEWRKNALRKRDIRTRSRAWREYCCESFCDTGAVWLTGSRAESTLGKLPLRFRLTRLDEEFEHGLLPI